MDDVASRSVVDRPDVGEDEAGLRGEGPACQRKIAREAAARISIASSSTVISLRVTLCPTPTTRRNSLAEAASQRSIAQC
jgi:hypothetical protein